MPTFHAFVNPPEETTKEEAEKRKQDFTEMVNKYGRELRNPWQDKH